MQQAPCLSLTLAGVSSGKSCKYFQNIVIRTPKSFSQDPEPKVTSPLCTNPKKLQFHVAGCQVVGLPFGLCIFTKLKQVGKRERERHCEDGSIRCFPRRPKRPKISLLIGIASVHH